MRLCQDPSCLLPYLQRDASIRPPYAATQISEAALRSEVERIHVSAAHETKMYYDRGMVAGDVGIGSWVVRWLLWHMLLHGDEQDVYTARTQPPLSLRRHDETPKLAIPRYLDGIDAPAPLADRKGTFPRPTRRHMFGYYR